MANINLEDIDNFVDGAEPWLAGASLAATTAAGVAPTPVTAAIAGGVNGLGVLTDAWQLGRAFYKGDYNEGVRNGIELVLGALGGKFIASGKKLFKLDKQLAASGAPRRMVNWSRNVRGNRISGQRTLELDKAINNSLLGYATFGLGNMIPIGAALNTESPYAAVHNVTPDGKVQIRVPNRLNFNAIPIRQRLSLGRDSTAAAIPLKSYEISR